ncbi:asparaginase [Virgibacillus sp. NKC19-3]|uniref:asparaginase n=1 Tax=Virgibacillus saliphilus TaxID=2831674 RepID=UPI001C9BAFA4|nr:asparaginase [Virgibacillus sp. NKC19-3]MBY7144332.1 asparaginase [Virgibacillus sp. NKC19-3]
MKPIQVYRGNYVESAHDVHIAVVSGKGDLLAYYGEPDRLTFARSSMKPFQALPIVESGAMDTYHLTEQELALFCASHSGEPVHRNTVAQVLQKINLEEGHLQCGTHIPTDIDSYNQLIKDGGALSPYYSNCSGKHTGMLAGCVNQKMDVDTYRELAHPYQQQIIDVIAAVSNFDREKIVTAVDGCGVPVHRVPLQNIALAFSRLAYSSNWKTATPERRNSLERIRDAMGAHPEMVAGTNRFDTDFMKTYGGRIVAKGGAEGVHCFGDKETGIGVAVKIDDGNGRGASVASMEVLKQLKIGDSSLWDQLDSYYHAPVLNARQEKIGEIRPEFKLKDLQ